MEKSQQSTLRHRANLRNLRSSIANEDSSNSTSPIDVNAGIKAPKTRAAFYAELETTVSNQATTDDHLTLFRIRYSVVGTKEAKHRVSQNQEALLSAIQDRIDETDIELTIYKDTYAGHITGFIETDPEAQSYESVIGRILKTLQNSIQVEQDWVWLETQTGCVCFDELDDQSTRSLVDALELTLSETSPEMNFLVFNPYLKRREQRDLALRNKLKDLIKNNSFKLYFQTIEDLASGNSIGIEVFTGFKDTSEQDEISAKEYLNCAIKNGMISELGALSRLIAVDSFKEIVTPDIKSRLKLWFNISAAELLDPNFIDNIKALNLPPTRIGLEIADDPILETRPAQRLLNILKEAGFAIALDHVTVSSPRLTILSKLSVDVIKVEIHETKPLIQAPETLLRLQFLRSLTIDTGISMTIIGIASEQQSDEAEQLGVTAVQGIHIGERESDLETLSI